MPYDKEKADRLYADAQANYKGPCDPSAYPVTVISIGGGTWVETAQPDVPPDDSYYLVQEHQVEMVWEWVEDGQTFTETAIRYNSPDYGVPFITPAPGIVRDGLIDFTCKARAQWGIQDCHPEDRGFALGTGRTYYGLWSDWFEVSFDRSAERLAAEAAAFRERLAWYNTLRQSLGGDVVETLPDDETRSAAELEAAARQAQDDWRAKRAAAAQRQREANRRTMAEQEKRRKEAAERRKRHEEAERVRVAEYQRQQAARELEDHKRLFYLFFKDHGADSLEAKAQLLRQVYHDPQWDRYDRAAEAVAEELGIQL